MKEIDVSYGSKATWRTIIMAMSATPSKADIRWCGWDVFSVPLADIGQAIRSPRRQARAVYQAQ
jgi:hypothetical protein